MLRGKHGGVVKKDIKSMGLKDELAQDRCAWRNITGGLTVLVRMPDIPCVWGSRMLSVYDDDDDSRDRFRICGQWQEDLEDVYK